MNKCNRITGECFLAFKKLTNLRVLQFMHYERIHVLQLYTALSNLTQLSELYLSNNRSVNDETLKCISQSCSHLEKLSLCNCDITDRGLIWISQLNRLSYLDLDSCDRITDTGVKTLVNFHYLEVLRLVRCTKITDDSMIQFANCCLNLKELNLHYCHNITDISILAFVKNASKKTVHLTLDVSGTGVYVEKRKLDYPMLEIRGYRSWPDDHKVRTSIDGIYRKMPNDLLTIK